MGHNQIYSSKYFVLYKIFFFIEIQYISKKVRIIIATKSRSWLGMMWFGWRLFDKLYFFFYKQMKIFIQLD